MWLIPILVFAVVAGLAYALLRHSNRHAMCVEERMETIRKANGAAPAQLPSRSSFFGLTSILAPQQPEERKDLQDQIIQAGIYSNDAIGHYYACKILLMVAPAVAGAGLAFSGYVEVSLALFCGAVAGGLGYLMPAMWLYGRMRSRNTAIKRSLPDFLDLMVVCLESGLSLQGSLSRVSEELGMAHAELGSEMLLVQKDVELGATIDQALKRFAVRSKCEEIRTLSSFMREASRFGTEISEALRMNSETLRTQRENDVEAMAQKAAVKILAPTLLLIFPAVLVVIAGPAVIQVLEAFAK